MIAFLVRRWKPLVFLVLALAVVGWVGLDALIGYQVDRAVEEAVRTEDDAPVDALIAVATSEGCALADRNRAIWALGRLGDPTALPALESLATGRDCDHARGVCQKEVRKALDGCRHGLELTRVSPPRQDSSPQR